MPDDERQSAGIAAIKAQVQTVKDAIERAEPSVPLPAAYPAAQLGLRPVYADSWGRMWRDDGDKLTRIYAPRPHRGADRGDAAHTPEQYREIIGIAPMTRRQAEDITKRST